MLELSPTDPCPCESGKIIRKCCLRGEAILRPRPAITKTPGAKTGTRHPGCYAGELADCSDKISREHHITHGILKLLSNEQGKVSPTGLPWQEEGKQYWIPTQNLTSNILCERHNNSLSPLDTIAIRFFKSFDRMVIELDSEEDSVTDRMYLFNGHDIERWMLKTICGLVFSRNSSSGASPENRWQPPLLWLKILYGQKPFPHQAGLFYRRDGEIGDTYKYKQGFGFQGLGLEPGGIYGATFIINSNTFILSMIKPPDDLENGNSRPLVYRPDGLHMTNGLCTRMVNLAWDVRGQGGVMNVHMEKTVK